MTQDSLLLIGCGNMGNALITRWHETLGHVFSSFHVVEPNNITLPENISLSKQLSDLPESFSPTMIVLAVKPQQMEIVLPQLKEKFSSRTTYLSIAAGKTLSFYEHYLGNEAAIIRVMPNTASMIGQGMSALVANLQVSDHKKTVATQMMQAVGEAVWLDNEAQMDIVTAISGSGPAYIYYFIECLIEAATACGLPEEMAMQLAKQTAFGAASMVKQSNESLDMLRQRVTSPGGTTEAALAQFAKNEQLQLLVKNAVQAAIQRAKELA